MSNARIPTFLKIILGFGFAFLYVPIFILIFYSFNASKLVAVWGGFSTKWYGKLLEDSSLLDALSNSLQIGIMTACCATVLGTVAGYVMARFGRFRGHSTFSSTITAPLVMPEVITGLASLLFFISLERVIGWPQGRGMLTITIAHITFAGAFVAVIVSSRLRDMDLSIEEAAMDLGAKPLKVFFVIVLPIIAPALLSGWLLAFTLSMDDLVITSFVAGPGSTTLPMKVFSAVRLGISPKINAIGTLIVLGAATIVITLGVVSAKFEKKRKKEAEEAFEQS